MASDTRAAGFYGKLPTLGDFVVRRLGRDFVAPWDEWLQRAMSASRKRLGGGWLDAYLTSPLWRFVLAPGVCGEDARAGVLMPSCDRVGRYFPLAVVATLPAREDLFRLAQAANEWFEEAENVLCSTLDEDPEFDLQHFDARVLALGLPGERTPVTRVVDEFGDGASLLLALGSGQTLGTAFAGIAEQLAGSAMGRCSLWWTAGSEQMSPALRLCRGLPSPDVYADMLSGGADTAAGDVPVVASGLPAIEDAVIDEPAEEAASIEPGGAVFDDGDPPPADAAHRLSGQALPAQTPAVPDKGALIPEDLDLGLADNAAAGSDTLPIQEALAPPKTSPDATMLSGAGSREDTAKPLPAIEDAGLPEFEDDFEVAPPAGAGDSGKLQVDDETGMPTDWQARSARESTHTAQGDAGSAATDEEAPPAPDRPRARKQSEGGLPLIEDAGLPSDDGFGEDKP